MKLIVIPPYRGMNWSPAEGHYMLRPLVDNMQKRGQLEGVEIIIDDGHPLEQSTESRDEAVYADITAGFLKRIKMYGEGDRFDAIVSSGGSDLGFYGVRLSSKIPVSYSIHAAVHVASLVGDRFSIITATDTQAQIIRHFVQLYGLSHKLASVRYVSRSSTQHLGIIRRYKREERSTVPEVKALIDDIVAQYITAIEKDRADSLIIGSPYQNCFVDDIRQGLQESGYGEIQLIGAFFAAVEMAKAMVNLGLMQAPRAYPSDSLKAKPEFR